MEHLCKEQLLKGIIYSVTKKYGIKFKNLGDFDLELVDDSPYTYLTHMCKGENTDIKLTTANNGLDNRTDFCPKCQSFFLYERIIHLEYDEAQDIDIINYLDTKSNVELFNGNKYEVDKNNFPVWGNINFPFHRYKLTKL